jgi:hypothetical protein
MSKISGAVKRLFTPSVHLLHDHYLTNFLDQFPLFAIVLTNLDIAVVPVPIPEVQKINYFT